MRTIRKRASPGELESWREDRIAKNDVVLYPFNYKAMRQNKPVLASVEETLFSEQGQICAYTGRRITRQGKPGLAGFHIEHLKPQHQCDPGEDCAHHNMVACWPEPNQKQAVEYGAVTKDDWPMGETDHLFVSPLREDCSNRFRFAEREDPPLPKKEPEWSNWMETAAPEDAAAIETIQKLNLNHHELRALRSSAVFNSLVGHDGTAWSLEQLKSIMAGYDRDESRLDAGEDIALEAFCFAIRQGLAFQIQQREAIAAQP
jgi:uncharacterized protein (TIGR02646 family)